MVTLIHTSLYPTDFIREHSTVTSNSPHENPIISPYLALYQLSALSALPRDLLQVLQVTRDSTS